MMGRVGQLEEYLQSYNPISLEFHVSKDLTHDQKRNGFRFQFCAAASDSSVKIFHIRNLMPDAERSILKYCIFQNIFFYLARKEYFDFLIERNLSMQSIFIKQNVFMVYYGFI